MKLIIDIPEEEYQNYLKMRPAYPEGAFCYIKAIQNGTPLDSVIEDIKAEIKNIPNDDSTKPIGNYDYCLGAEHERKVILEIIDRHLGKGTE